MIGIVKLLKMGYVVFPIIYIWLSFGNKYGCMGKSFAIFLRQTFIFLMMQYL